MNELLLRLAVTIDTGSGQNTTTVNIPTANEADLLTNGLNVIYFLAGAVAVIVIIFAGIMYTTSSGDAGRVAKAKNLITYSIVGLIVVLVAFTITSFVSGRFSL